MARTKGKAGRAEGGGVVAPQTALSTRTAVALLGLFVALTLYAAHWTATSLAPPLGSDAPGTSFAEGRAMQHVIALAGAGPGSIGERQVGTEAIHRAADYVEREMQALCDAAEGSAIACEVSRSRTSGSFNLEFLGASFVNKYENLTNVAVRLYNRDAPEERPKGVLLLSHFDSTLASPGASDAGAAVSSILEFGRAVVARGEPLDADLVLLANGGEETLMQAAHGFSFHPWMDRVGSFINVESTGSAGPDVVFQGSSWTLEAYRRGARRPLGSSLVQLLFEVEALPADTDYKVLSTRRLGRLHGIDMALGQKAQTYHTHLDNPGELVPGSLQCLGENIDGVAYEFMREMKRQFDEDDADANDQPDGIYFSFLRTFFVTYSFDTAQILHLVPLASICVLLATSNAAVSAATVADAGAALAAPVAFSILFAVLRVAATGAPMVWFSRPFAAFALYLPPAAAAAITFIRGLATHNLNTSGPRTAKRRSRELSTAYISLAIPLATVGALLTFSPYRLGSYLPTWLAASFVVAAVCPVRLDAVAGGVPGVLWRLVAVAVPAAEFASLSGGYALHLLGKIGLSGNPPFEGWKYVADAAVAFVISTLVIDMIGFLPLVVRLLPGKTITRALYVVAVVAAVATARWEPYSAHHPKRLMALHVHRPDNTSVYVMSAFDSVPTTHALQLHSNHHMRELLGLAEGGAAALAVPTAQDWLPMYPMSRGLSGVLVPGAPGLPPGSQRRAEVVLDYECSAARPCEGDEVAEGHVKMYLTLYTGEPAWGVVNITGAPIRSWNLGAAVRPTGLPSDPPHMYAIRFAGNGGVEKQELELEVPEGAELHVAVAAKFYGPTDALRALQAHLSDSVALCPLTVVHSRVRFVAGEGRGAADVFAEAKAAEVRGTPGAGREEL
ncbi:unnamed protein product [Pedinophyceae sp. YPF-701]|nr:unnamed protein product [Pedinophyceae sp. YPF-701]